MKKIFYILLTSTILISTIPCKSKQKIIEKNEMTIKVRFADSTDFDWILATKHIKKKNSLKKLITYKQFMIAEEGKKKLGYIFLTFFYNKIPFINHLYIEKSYKNKNIEKELINFLEEKLLEMKYDTLMTSSNVINEDDMSKWYEQFGFEKSSKYADTNKGVTIQLYKKKLK